MLHRLWRDARELKVAAKCAPGLAELAWVLFYTDSYRLLVLQRAREAARRLGIPFLNTLLRMTQQVYAGLEIGNDVEVGEGVYFVHPVGIVIGGDAKVGKRVRFYGSNTVGTAKDDGYPVLGDDVYVGAGARILGPIHVGARARIGANAVVLCDVPDDAVAVGVPAKIIAKASERAALHQVKP